MQRKINFKMIAAITIIIFISVGVPFIYIQSKYLALRIFNGSIVKIELVVYADKPFESEIISLKTLAGDSAAADELKQEMNLEAVCFFHSQNSSTVLFIYFTDDKTVNAYVGSNKIGLNYGKVWLKVKNLDEIIKDFK